MALIEVISEFLQKGRAKQVKALVQQGLDGGVEARDILNNGLLAGMMVVGEKFKNNEVFVPEVLVAAGCMTRPALFRYVSENPRQCMGFAAIRMPGFSACLRSS